MRSKIVFLFLVLLFSTTAHANKHYIKRIIDTNLFELGNNQRVKLYGLEIPSFLESNNSTAKLAKVVFDWENENLVDKWFSFDFIKQNQDSVYEVVIVTLRTFARDNINELMLLKGFATLNLHYLDFYYPELHEAELLARENEIGIWENSNHVITKELPDPNFPLFSTKYERPYLPLLCVSVASLAIAWDSFTTASELQKTIDDLRSVSANADVSDYQFSKTRKYIVGVACLVTGVITTIISFKQVEVRTSLQSVTLSYRF